MFTVNNREYAVKFSRKPVVVQFFKKGKKQAASRMATTATLISKEGFVITSATVRQHYKDAYDRKSANEYAFKKLVSNPEWTKEVKTELLSQFFNKK